MILFISGLVIGLLLGWKHEAYINSIIETIKLLEHTAKEKGLLVTSVIDKSIKLRGDKFEFSQIITNLLSNSIKYTNSGKIQIILSRISNDICCIDIIDTGIGIKKEYIPLIFNRFFRTLFISAIKISF